MNHELAKHGVCPICKNILWQLVWSGVVKGYICGDITNKETHWFKEPQNETLQQQELNCNVETGGILAIVS